LRHRLPAPDRHDVVVVLAQIADLLGADAAAPQVAVGRDVGAGPAGVTGDHLVALVQDPLGKLVILGTEGLREAGNALWPASVWPAG
jgi:hypothetical protein